MTRAGRKRNRKREEWGTTLIPLTQVRAPEPEPAGPPPEPKALTQDEALEVLWSAKSAFILDDEGLPRKDPETGKFLTNPHWCNAFVYGTLQRDVDVWRGDQNEKKPVRVIPKDTRVLVTMVSRFGHVGIRDNHLVPASNGYCATCQPEDLTDWNMAP